MHLPSCSRFVRWLHAKKNVIEIPKNLVQTFRIGSESFGKMVCSVGGVVLLSWHASLGMAQDLGSQSIGTSPASRSKPLNVLWMVSDDLNHRLGCYGHVTAKTPHLDALAQRGVLFDRAYCTFPLCGPSRNSMLTGLYPNSTGILNNGQIFRQSIPKRPSVPQLFRLSNYFVGRIGKLYHYNVPNSVGTNGHDDPASWELELNPAGVDRLLELPKTNTLIPGQFGGTLSWLSSTHPESMHTDSLQAKDAEWVLERCARDRERPFFLALGFFRPHTPYIAPQEYFQLHEPERIGLVQDVEEDRRDIPPAALASGKKEQDEMSEATAREAIQAYDASISFMDAQVGKVMAALDRLGLSDNTIIMFTSDHGYHVGEHGLWQKMSLFEESARVPLIVVAPGLGRSGSVVSTPVSHVDLAPTLLESCGLSLPEGLQGQSLLPMLQDPQHVGRGWALTHVTRGGGDKQKHGYSIRTARWRYTEWDEGRGGVELYDHDADPRERDNLAHASHPKKGRQQDVLSELSGMLRDAVQASFPANGTRPAVQAMNWAPNLTEAAD